MTTEVEQKALDMGWSPKEEFKGDPAKWIEAEAFVKRGEELMPILQANNRRQQAEIATLRGELTAAKGAITASTEAIEELRAYNSEATRKVMKEQKKDLVKAIEIARKDGEVDTVVQLTEQLDEHEDALDKAEAAKGKPEGKPSGKVVEQPKVDPIFEQWKTENRWFGSDKRRTALAIGIGQEIKADPATAYLDGRPFLDRIEQEVNKVLGNGQQRTGHSKVEGGKGGNGDGGTGGGKSYADLPADAKEACERAGQRLIGPNRAYKTATDWRKKYVEDFFAE